ncbi:MAG: T9SS type A sorting domain-containing protein [Candidatus Cloacimonetes bacterium]|nr:T9SS type A sorting domain-containing protein [Candidatus Cloacimonadota bacterium]
MKRFSLLVVLLMSVFSIHALYRIEGAINDVNPQSITVVDDYAFLPCNWELMIADISDIGNPQLLDVVSELYHGRAVIKDTLAYVSEYQSLKVVDVSDPLQPVLVAEIAIPAQILKFDVAEPYLYAFFSDDTMQVIDITEPANPQTVYSDQAPMLPSYITLAGNLMFISGGSDGYGNSSIQIIDVSDPSNPMIRYTYNTSNLATGITVDGNIAYIAARYAGMLIWDISNPNQPNQLGVFNPGRAIMDVSIQGSTACLANELNGILMVDISNPANPLEIGTCDTPGFAYHVALQGTLAYVCGNAGLQIVNVSDPLPSPNVIGSYYNEGDCYNSLALGTNSLYMINSWEGLKVLDISEPSLPVLQADYPDMGAYGIQVLNNKAYIANQFGSYDILDITDPANPQPLGSYSGMDGPISSAVVGTRAYVLDQFEGLSILNIADSANPTLLGTYSDIVSAYAIAIRGTHAYIIDRAVAFPKVKVINVANPSSPQYAGENYMPDEPNAIAILGNYAYIVSGGAGLEVYQIINYASLLLLESILPQPGSNLVYCFIEGGRLYASDDNLNNIYIYDLSDPSQPALVKTITTNFATYDMKLRNGLLYTANSYAGMHILDPDAPSGIEDPTHQPPLVALSNYPNPFNPSTTISYSIPEGGPVKLNIYNLKGQLIKVLINKEESSGDHSIMWDGRDRNGNIVAGGVYLYRLSTPGSSVSKKMLMMK